MSYSRDYLYNEKNGVALQPIQASEASERTRLQQPVKLQPSWEENNLPEDELNFKNLTMDEASLQLNPPPDKYNLVYFTFLIHGIGVLMPWNMFITATDYFIKYKFSSGYIGFLFPYVPNFMQYLTFCSQVPNVLFNWMNIFVQIGGNITVRIVWAICAEIILFIITVILAMVSSSSWPYAFFYITMICVVFLNMANGIYQNTVFGMSAKLPPKYTGAIILGNNISGTFASVVSIISSAVTSNIRTAAIYYFITALFVLLVCFDTYFALPLNRFYRHFELKEKKEQELHVAMAKGVKERPPYLYIVKKAMMQLVNVFLLFFVTLAVFPAVLSNVNVSDPDFFISSNYYVGVTCFVTFNFFSMIGSIIPTYIIWPSPKYLWIPVVLRLAYIPLFLMCNYQVEGVTRALPVVISSDWGYWILSVTLGLTNGYFSSIAMMYVPGTVEEKYAGTAGMFGGAALITGIFVGILTTFLWPWMIGHVGN